MNQTNLQQILKEFLSPTNELRTQAESRIKELRATNANELLSALANFIAHNDLSSEFLNDKVLACVLLKKYYLDDRQEEKDLQQITPAQILDLKILLKASLNFANDPLNLLRRKAEIICKLCKKDESYPEIVQFICQLAQSPSSSEEHIVKGKQFAMYAFELLSEYHLPQEQIVQHSGDFMNIFNSSLNDGDVRVKVATLKALTSFLTCIEDEDQALKYKGMMGTLINVVIVVLKTNEEEGKASLSSLIELTQSFADIWSNDIQNLIEVCSNIMNTESFELGTRQSALEIVSTLAESNAKLVRDQHAVLQKLFFPALFMMMTQVEDADDLQAWADKDEEAQGKDDSVSVASDALERLSDLLGEKTIINCTGALILEGAKNTSNWKFRQAAYIFLGMICQACAKKFKKEFKDTVQLIAAGVIDEHPRVRFQSLMALGMILNVASPNIQLQYHQDLLTVFVNMMANESFVKLKTQAVSVTINFVRGLIEAEEGEEEDQDKIDKNKAILLPYSDQLVKSISQMLELSISTNYAPLQLETLALLAVLAETLTDKFVAHYSTFMPGLKTILKITPSETKPQKELRANCIQTIGTILDSVKEQPELCRADALEITTQLVISLTNLEDTDPQLQAIQNAISMLAASLKEQFKPFLPQIMESLIKDAKRDVDFKIVDATEEELEEADDGEKPVEKILLQIKGVEGKKAIQMNTTALENKINALEVIGSVAQALGVVFFDYVQPVAHLVATELIMDKFSSQVRKQSTRLCVTLLDCCPEKSQQVELFNIFLPQIALQIKLKLERTDFRSLKWLLKELQRNMRVMSTCKQAFLSENQITELIQLCQTVLQTTELDKQTRLDQFETEKKKMDEEDIEVFEQQLVKDAKVWSYIGDIAGSLLKVMPAESSPQVQQNLLPLYSKALLTLDKKNNSEEVMDALCLLCDCLEFGSETLFQSICKQAAPKLMEVMQKFGQDDFNYVQTCIFGLGCIALRTPSGSFAFLSQTLTAVKQIIMNQGQFMNEKGEIHTCVDNAVSTLGKCIYQHGESNSDLVGADFIKVFLQRIPLVVDCDEAQAAHLLFLNQVSSNPIFRNYSSEAKDSVLRLGSVHEQKPELEILNDEGAAALKSLLSQGQ